MSKRIFRTFKIFVIESLFLMLMLHFFYSNHLNRRTSYFSISPSYQSDCERKHTVHNEDIERI